ncbi:B86 [miniopterid betaherpesvirus 1]|uniref:B86 n=1 Tax=miniopterid betaherpesvirus 1 TaxID=3070189 RepID=I3VQ79_9BETA|nr:B86 [miniopterid betaherpesvirus 1]AFK83923.1 B86 [miniopterid betaherpesvirus 1]
MEMENWTARELLTKIEVPLDVLMHIKTTVAEEMFDNFRMYYGDDPERYNLSFEVIFGTYCNRMEWVQFLSTALATAAHAVRFDDLNKMTTGKMFFYIQVPRVATGTGIPPSRQTTIMVTKYSEKTPIAIPFELSAACLTHLKETFEETLLDKLLNIDALNTVLRAVKNTADAMERGLVHSFLLTLLRKAPPYFIVRTLLENATISRQAINRVQRANITQGFKSKMTNTIFLLNRTKDRVNIQKFLLRMVESVTESILDNPETYVTSNGTRLSGVMVGTINIVQTILSLLSASVTKESVRAPASYGQFVMSKENAVTAIAHHSIMADFGAQADKIAAGTQSNTNDSKFFNKASSFAQVPMDVLKLGERSVALEHLRRVYKNTDTRDPLEKQIELTFFFPIGLFISADRGYTTVENKIRLTDTSQNNLPTCAYFYNKDKVLQRMDYSDALRTVCHPIFNDCNNSLHIFEQRGPPEDTEKYRQLCRCEFEREPMRGAVRRIAAFYRRRRDIPRTTNEVKQDFCLPGEFFKPGNPTLYTELHPCFDFTHCTVNNEVVALCTPRIMVGNMPEALAPPDFQEARARQALEHIKLRPPPETDDTLKLMHQTLTDPQYPEVLYLIDIMIHGNRDAFDLAKDLVARCIFNNFRQRGTLAFLHSYDMVAFIAGRLGDGAIPPALHAHYRSVVTIVRFIHKFSCLTGLNGRLVDEPLLAYVNALHDARLLPPFLNNLPREDTNLRIIANREPLTNAQFEQRLHGVSDVARMAAIDEAEPLFIENERLSDEDVILRKIYYFCLVPAMCNNRACGMGINLHDLYLKVFYKPPFVVQEETSYAAPDDVDPLLVSLLEEVATADRVTATDAAKELFLLLQYMGEHPQMLDVRTELDAAQRHAPPGFQASQFILYNGCCITNPPKLLAPYCWAIPFHRFYSDPLACAGLEEDVQNFLAELPHYNRNDGGFPLPTAFAHEYHHWYRTPFSRYSANCPNTMLSVLTLAVMHHKLSPVSTALHSRLGLHPGFALTAVRTDVFDSETLIYSGKSCNAVILNNPIVTKEERDLNTIYHVTQNINNVDMGFGYSSTTCTALLKRVRSDMGCKTQDLFRVFPMHVYRNDDLDTWIRQFVGTEKIQYLDADAISMLTYGSMSEKNGPALLHGQRSTCELIATPVTADINYFKIPNTPRGRSSCMLGVDPYDIDAAQRALYNHTEPDAQTFLATNNPWASQKGSLGDILYNIQNRDRLGYNSQFYSPCAQFFNTDDIINANKTLFRTIDEYMIRSTDCIRGETDVQYICVEGTDDLVERPCKFLQEALPIQMSTTQALLESQAKGLASNINETHYGNYMIGETIPFQGSILFNA